MPPTPRSFVWMILMLVVLAKGLEASPATAAREARVNDLLASIEVRLDEALFTTIAWMNQTSKTAADTASLSPEGRQVWSRLAAAVAPDDLARYTALHDSLHAEYDHMLGYLAVVLALNTSPPPEMRLLDQELCAWNAANGVADRWTEKRLAELEPLAACLREFHARYPLSEVFAECRPSYQAVGASDLQRAGAAVRNSIDYLRLGADEIPPLSRIVIVPNLIGPRGEMGPRYRGVMYDVKGPRQSPVYRAHEFLHSLVAGSTRDPQARDGIIATIGAAYEAAAGTPAVGSYADPVLWFDDCLVRALDAKVMHPDDPAAIEREATFEADRGFTLVPTILDALAGFEASGESFPSWFPQLLQRLGAAART